MGHVLCRAGSRPSVGHDGGARRPLRGPAPTLSEGRTRGGAL